MIRFESSLITNDRTGKLFVRYVPVLDLAGSGYPCASGELRFSSHDVEVGASTTTHDMAKCEARRYAVEALAEIARRAGVQNVEA